MSAFDARIRIGSAGVRVLKENDENPAYEAELELNTVALAPVGPSQLLPIPLGTLRIPLNMDTIDGLVEQLQEAASQMERRPQVQTATSLDGVDKMAQFQESLK